MDPGPNFRDFSAASCFPSFGGSQGDRCNLGWRITSGALIPQKPYSAWWFQKYVRLLILDFKISYEAGNWKNWKIDFKILDGSKNKTEIAQHCDFGDNGPN